MDIKKLYNTDDTDERLYFGCIAGASCLGSRLSEVLCNLLS